MFWNWRDTETGGEIENYLKLPKLSAFKILQIKSDQLKKEQPMKICT